MNTRRRILAGAKSAGGGVTYQIIPINLELSFNGQNQSGYTDYSDVHGWAKRFLYNLTFTDSNNATLTIDYTYAGRSGETRHETPITVGFKKSYGAFYFSESPVTISYGGPGAIFTRNSDDSGFVIRLFYGGSLDFNLAYDLNLTFV